MSELKIVGSDLEVDVETWMDTKDQLNCEVGLNFEVPVRYINDIGDFIKGQVELNVNEKTEYSIVIVDKVIESVYKLDKVNYLKFGIEEGVIDENIWLVIRFDTRFNTIFGIEGFLKLLRFQVYCNSLFLDYTNKNGEWIITIERV